MSTINMDSILKKAKVAVESETFQKKIDNIIDGLMVGDKSFPTKYRATVSGANLAADKFIKVLQNEINSNAMSEGKGGLSHRGLGDTAVKALTKLTCGSPVKVGRGMYQIDIWFDGNLHRDSLAPDEYDGVDNIAALLNKGYSAANTIYGTWPGHGYADYYNIPSLREREGLHFVENAVRTYMENYAKKYGVVDIKINDVYN